MVSVIGICFRFSGGSKQVLMDASFCRVVERFAPTTSDVVGDVCNFWCLRSTVVAGGEGWMAIR